MSSLSTQQSTPLKSVRIIVFVIIFGLLIKLSAAAPTFTTTANSSSISGTTASSSSVPFQDKHPSILLFEDIHFKGIASRMHVRLATCVNLIGKLNDFYSSADTMGSCFIMCEHLNCRGKCARIVGAVPRLAVHGLNDCVSSLRTCDESEKRNNRRSTSASFSTWFLRRKKIGRATTLKQLTSTPPSPSTPRLVMTAPPSSDVSSTPHLKSQLKHHIREQNDLVILGVEDRSGNSRKVMPSSSIYNNQVHDRRNSTEEHNSGKNNDISHIGPGFMIFKARFKQDIIDQDIDITTPHGYPSDQM